jgi:CRP/FNR family transcriptional regulator, polysaccharide utilization system transcription regulator
VNANIALTVREVFDGLARQTLTDFEALGQKSWYPPGVILFEAGEPCSSILRVYSGQVSLSVSGCLGDAAKLHIAQPGELIGLKAVLCGEAYAATARTEGPCEVIVTSRDEFSAFVLTHADAAFRIVSRLSHHLGIALDQLRCASTIDLPEQLN